jgi:hypothetical protein
MALASPRKDAFAAGMDLGREPRHVESEKPTVAFDHAPGNDNGVDVASIHVVHDRQTSGRSTPPTPL